MKENKNYKNQGQGALAAILDLEGLIKELNQERQYGAYALNAVIEFLLNIYKNGKFKKPDDMGEEKAAKAAIDGALRKGKQVQEFFKIIIDEGKYDVIIFCKNIAEINKLERRLKKLQEFTDYLVSIFERNSKITKSQAELFFYIGLVLSEAERMKKELIA